MRQGALCPLQRADLGRHLPLPDVPAGAGQPVRAVHGIRLGDFAWIKGAPATYQSSSIAERGFCGHCGTPLSFRYLETDKISVTIGSLDQPAGVRPTEQVGMESRVPWLHDALALPGKRTEDDPPPGGLAAITSYQEPTGRG